MRSAVLHHRQVESGDLFEALADRPRQDHARLPVEPVEVVGGGRLLAVDRISQLKDKLAVDRIFVVENRDVSGEYRRLALQLGIFRDDGEGGELLGQPPRASLGNGEPGAQVRRRPEVATEAPFLGGLAQLGHRLFLRADLLELLRDAGVEAEQVRNGDLLVPGLLHVRLLCGAEQPAAVLAPREVGEERSERWSEPQPLVALVDGAQSEEYRAEQGAPLLVGKDEVAGLRVEGGLERPRRRVALQADARRLRPRAGDVNERAADIHPRVERPRGELRRTEDAVLVGIAAEEEVDELDEARLARAVARLAIGGTRALFGEEDVQARPEGEGLEAVQVAADRVDHDALLRRRPRSSSTALMMNSKSSARTNQS